MAHWRSRGMVHRYNIAGLFALQSEVVLVQGNLETAYVLMREGLALFRKTGARGNLDHTLLQMGRVETERGELLVALKAYGASLNVAREISNRRGMVEAVEAIGLLLLRAESDPLRKRGAHLWGWAQMQRSQHALIRPPIKQRFQQDAESYMAHSWSEKVRRALLLEGSLLVEADAVSLAQMPFTPATHVDAVSGS